MARPGKRVLLTKLVDRDEVMKFLAIAEATGLPALLEGVPGVGKTRALLDYAKCYYRDGVLTEAEVNKKALDETFMIELDEGTRSGDVKGRVDLKKLLTEQTYHIDSPIVDAKFLLINEIDKASSATRNAFLGIMNEKMLMQGREKLFCQWDVFCATCNEIPVEEKDSPFWDRFVLKAVVKRVTKSSLLKYYENQAANAAPKRLDIYMPTAEELAGVKIDENKMNQFMNVCYDKLSDRTLTHVPKIVAAITFIYRIPVSKALIKCAEMLVDLPTGKKLSSLLEPKEVTEIRSKIDMIGAITDKTALQVSLKDINGVMAKFRDSPLGQSSPDIMQELKDELAVALEQNPIIKSMPTSNPFVGANATMATGTPLAASTPNTDLATLLSSGQATGV